MVLTRNEISMFLLNAFVAIQLFCFVSHAASQRQQQQQQQDQYYYDDYYYEDYASAPGPAAAAAPSAQGGGAGDVDQYDLGELVKAWKAYIKDKEPPRGGRPFQRAPVVEYECPPREESYRNPSDTQCDKYYECNIKGEEKEKLCPDGLMFDIKSENCDYPAKVNCTGRPDLQPAQPTKNCPRANGFFPFPANESCQKFWDCRGGTSYLQVCPAGVIFDPKIDACTTPDQSNRFECAAGKFLGFECPKYEPDQVLRFGNHERLAHPTDCQKFFSCLRNGHPRAGACPRNTVFSEKEGSCADPASVKGCEDYWKEKLEEGLEYEYYE